MTGKKECSYTLISSESNEGRNSGNKSKSVSGNISGNDSGICVLVMCDEIDLLEMNPENMRFPDSEVLRDMKRFGVSSLLIGVSCLSDISDVQIKCLECLLFDKIQKMSNTMKIPVRMIGLNYSGEFSFQPDDPEIQPVSFICGIDGRTEVAHVVGKLLSGNSCAPGNSDSDENLFLTEDDISKNLIIPEIPDFVICCDSPCLPDIMIWQTTYSEFYFMKKTFSKMTSEDFFKAVCEFRDRKRRYGQ